MGIFLFALFLVAAAVAVGFAPVPAVLNKVRRFGQFARITPPA